MKVRIGIALGGHGDAGRFAAAVDQLEQLGVDSLWLQEMVFGAQVEPFIGMAHALSRTEHLKVGTAVAVLPGRHPVLGPAADGFVLQGERHAQQHRSLLEPHCPENGGGCARWTPHGGDYGIGIQNQSHIAYDITSSAMSLSWQRIPASRGPLGQTVEHGKRSAPRP